MAIYIKNIEQIFKDYLQQEDINQLTQAVFDRISASGMLQTEYVNSAAKIEKLKVIISQFWLTVLTGTPFRKQSTLRTSSYYLPLLYVENYIEVFLAVIDENFFGLMGQKAKSKLTVHIYTFLETIEWFMSQELSGGLPSIKANFLEILFSAESESTVLPS